MIVWSAALVVGIALLAVAADDFVVGAARLARLLQMPPVVVGAVIVGFGTSAPELLVSGIAAGRGDIDVGVGNVVGSNVANLTLILGAAALLLAMPIRSGILRREAPLSMAAVVAFAVAVQGGFHLVEGVVLLLAMVVALVLLIRGSADRDTELVAEVVGEFDMGGRRVGREVLRTLAGLAGTVAGAWALVWGAQGLAERFGLADGFVGLSLIAVGTSLPELVTVVAAARHHEHELIVGNLLGSNLFNSLAVGGVVALIGPDVAAEAALRGVGVGAMVATAAVAIGLMVWRSALRRADGTVLLVLFVGFLVLTYATQGPPAGALG